MHIRQQMMYRMSFFAGVVGQAFSYGVQFLMIHILTSSFGTLAGWKPEEVLFMYAFVLPAFLWAGGLLFLQYEHQTVRESTNRGI